MMHKYKKIQINKTLTYLDKIFEEAQRLYKICEEENIQNIVTPTIWLLNQDTMREKWIEYNKLLESVTEESKNILLNNNLSKYMTFMYDSYPEGFGKKLHSCCDNKIDHGNNAGKYNIKYNVAEIYLSLTEK